MAGRLPGSPKTGGRQKGSVNKITASFKEAVLKAYDGIGGTDQFIEWAKLNQTEFYKIASKLIPIQGSEPDGSHKVVHKVTFEIVDSSGS